MSGSLSDAKYDHACRDAQEARQGFGRPPRFPWCLFTFAIVGLAVSVWWLVYSEAFKPEPYGVRRHPHAVIFVPAPGWRCECGAAVQRGRAGCPECGSDRP